MSLTTKINKYIKSIDFEPDGSLFLTIQEEFEITLEDKNIVKVPHIGERIKLEIDDPNTTAIAGGFAVYFFDYWNYYKANNSSNPVINPE